MLAKNVEERVVLRGDDGDLEHLAYKIRFGGATSTGLRVQVTHIRHRHVVGILERVVPIEIPVQNAGAIARCLEPFSVGVDTRHSAQKLFPMLKEFAVMVEVVDIDFKAALSE